MSIGSKLKTMRLTSGLTQIDLADRCELSKSFISLLERDLTSPSIATLNDILTVFNITLEEFFSKQKTEKFVFRKEDVFVKEANEDGIEINWLINNAQKNDMEPILVNLEPGSVLFDEEGHKGEEFGYILSGAITLCLNGKRYTVKKGESYYFHSDMKHKLSNESNKKAKVLMISSPPSY